MKKILSVFLSILMLAGSFSIPQAAYAAQAQCRAITESYTCEYDITGDGQADEIQFVCTQNYERMAYTDLYIYVNGLLIHDISDTFFYDAYIYYIRLSNGKPFLYIGLSSENDDFIVSAVFQYKNDALKKMIDCNKLFAKYTYHLNTQSVAVNGNTISIKSGGQFFSTAYTKVTQKYIYKNGKFVPNATGSINLLNSKKSLTLTTARKLSVYKSPTAKKATASIPKNKKVKMSSYKFANGKLFFKVSYNKKTYWLKASARYFEDSKMPFKNLLFGG